MHIKCEGLGQPQTLQNLDLCTLAHTNMPTQTSLPLVDKTNYFGKTNMAVSIKTRDTKFNIVSIGTDLMFKFPDMTKFQVLQ